ncbi:branched-chain amino acid ABC transporter permease [Belnapia sp. T18]|jgi:branched-chain amino acid transport system permease protein|uniref:Branched-chain amino acid ABC transporter permease n=1 Tax=Belnapia arida TaxID=2804533 RepID=A0ABS1U640_9PROT|nr:MULTISPECIES: branched-chain amino acid ABC transporter permease [Belnapia]MBL6079615.1 branched-chain amino acid ABC transporter permease [Belnapia arida]
MLGNLFAGFYQFADVFAFLVLSAAGLAIIFGMMGVINMAHGEFVMCGVYVTAASYHAGLPLPLAQACGTAVAFLIGMVLEAVVIRPLYTRPLDSLLVTWGLSLVVTQGTLVLVGSTFPGIGTPLGGFRVGDYTFSAYRMVLFAAAIGVLGFVWFLFLRTRFGIQARAVMQNPGMAQALGVRRNRVYALSFGVGAGLAGFCGALYAPTMSLIPTMGSSFIVESFVTVVVGGSSVLLGTAPAAVALAVIRTGLNAWYGQIIGQIGLLVAVILIIRVLPDGFTGWLTRRTA